MADPGFIASSFWESAQAAVPPGFWGAVFFVLGAVVGSFLNVCIHRLPRDESVVSPPSHCPRCRYAIPLYLNLPLIAWLVLRGRCKNCGAPISSRYFWVELLTGLLFLLAWLVYGPTSPLLALVISVFLAGLVAATFIDFEHFIIPDEITFGGIAAGFFFSFLVPALHGADLATTAMLRSFWGIAAGGGILYAIVRLGKLLFGRQVFEWPAPERLIFTESALHLPDQVIPYEDLFYRKSDMVRVEGARVELPDRCYASVPVLLSPEKLQIGEELLNPEQVPHMEITTDQVVLPREAMGFGDVKFMAAIGAFLGAGAVLFCLLLSSVIGALVGILLIAAGKREWSSRIPYGPYIALAALVWVFGAEGVQGWWREQWNLFVEAVKTFTQEPGFR